MKPEEIFRLSDFSKEDFLNMMTKDVGGFQKRNLLQKSDFKNCYTTYRTQNGGSGECSDRLTCVRIKCGKRGDGVAESKKSR